MPVPGDRLGPYTLVAPLGRGGMGEVWVASGGDGTEVAVKLLPEGALGDDTARARFQREVFAAQRVEHPGVQAVLAADVEADPPWLATDLVAGPTLAQRVAASGALPGPEVHALAVGLAAALAAVHAAGVVHRDVSPANVVLGTEGPVLIDFGIARIAEATTLTQAGTVVGTAGWLAPERLRDDEATPAADVWSFGAVLAFAATGRPPADGSRAEVVLRKVLDGDLDLRGLAPWLDGVVRRCLDPDQARRPTAVDLAAELRTGPDPELGPTVPLIATTAAPAEVGPTAEVSAAADPRGGWDWRPAAVRTGIVAAGGATGLLAPPLVVVLVIALAMLLAIALRMRAEARSADRPSPVGAGTVVAAASLAAVTALAQVIGLLVAVIVLVAAVVVFFAIGGDLG